MKTGRALSRVMIALLCAWLAGGVGQPTSVPAHANDGTAGRCPWLLAEHLNKITLDEMDPGDRRALQDLLQRVYEDPKRRLGAEDRDWVARYHLSRAIDEVREAGRANARDLATQRLKKQIAVGAGMGIPALLLARHLLRTAREQVDLETELNREYGLKLEGNSQEDLRWLQATLECNPKKTKRLPHEKMDYGEVLPHSQVAVALLLDQVFGYRTSNAVKSNLAKPSLVDRMRKLYLTTGLTFCTRWGDFSEKRWGEWEVESVLNFADTLTGEDRRLLRHVRGLVRVSPKYQPYSDARAGIPVNGIYVPASQRIDLYSLNGEPGPTLAHELAHGLSDASDLTDSVEWRQINWKYNAITGWEPKPDVWWPDAYGVKFDPTGPAAENPEETWGWAVGCYYSTGQTIYHPWGDITQWSCRELMEKFNPPLFEFVKAKLNTPSR